MRRHLPVTVLLSFLLLELLLESSAAATAEAADRSHYLNLPGAKALAIAVDAPERTSIVQGQSGDIAAATAALADCEAQRSADHGPCELLLLNDETITSARQMRAALPSGPTPLYLWRYEGASATVWLVGSIHVLKAALYPLAPQYERAFEISDTLVLEVDLTRYPATEMRRRLTQHATLPAGQKTRDLLPVDMYRRLTEALDRQGFPPMGDNVKPGFLMNQLVVGRLLALGYQQEYGLEQHFLASIGGRRVLELESLDDQLALLFGQPIDLQIQLLAEALDQEAGIEPLITSMLIAWLSGDDAEFMNLFEQQAGDSEALRAFNDQLLGDRNIGMASRIREYLLGTGSYFVLIGAAHFIGERGIIELLAQQGIQGRRISSDTPPALLN